MRSLTGVKSQAEQDRCNFIWIFGYSCSNGLSRWTILVRIPDLGTDFVFNVSSDATFFILVRLRIGKCKCIFQWLHIKRWIYITRKCNLKYPHVSAFNWSLLYVSLLNFYYLFIIILIFLFIIYIFILLVISVVRKHMLTTIEYQFCFVS